VRIIEKSRSARNEGKSRFHKSRIDPSEISDDAFDRSFLEISQNSELGHMKIAYPRQTSPCSLCPHPEGPKFSLDGRCKQESD
jgi:hypothetical protein